MPATRASETVFLSVDVNVVFLTVKFEEVK
jgi:hypothetical protein